MLTEIIECLKSNPRVGDWQLRRKRVIEHQLYLTGPEVESRRRSDTEAINADVFVDGDGRGVSTLQFTPGPVEGLSDRVERAVSMAALAGNPRHELPDPSAYPAVQLRDPSLAERPWETMDQWRKELQEAVRRERDIRLSAAEFFVSLEDTEFQNSRGAWGRYPATRAFIEMVLLAGDGKQESENYHAVTVRAASRLNLAKIVQERAAYARDMLKACTPKSRSGPVVVSGDSLVRLFQPFIHRVDGQYIYRKFFKTTVGDDIFNGCHMGGDPLDLAIDPGIPYATASAPFDEEGLALHRVQVIKQGRVENLAASKRYADYLGIVPTGAVTNIVVGTGSISMDELTSGPVCHIVAFAELHADPISGDFVSEIRLGYDIDADGRALPIKGGAVSGNVFKAFAACKMSREAAHYPGYFGPKAVRFDDLAISGE